MTDQKKYEQLEKLARTLIKSGLASSSAEAMKRAKEILKIKPDKEKIDVENLPKIDDLQPADTKSGEGELDKDRSLRELMEEDAERVYGGNSKQNTTGKQ